MSNFHKIIGDEDFYKSIRRFAQIIFGKFKFNGKWESPASTFSAYKPDDLVSIVYEDILNQYEKSPKIWEGLNRNEISRRFKHLVKIRFIDELRKYSAKKITKEKKKNNDTSNINNLDFLIDDMAREKPFESKIEEFKKKRIDPDMISDQLGEFKKGNDIFFNYGYGSNLNEQFYIAIIDIMKLMVNPKIGEFCRELLGLKMADYQEREIAKKMEISVGSAVNKWRKCREEFGKYMR